jgi:hypothetical protein
MGFQPLPANFRLGLKGLSMENTLAYYGTAEIMSPHKVLLYRNLGRRMALPSNIRPGRKDLPRTKTLAYLASSSVVKKTVL